jgi:hypothetical protein
MGRSFRECVFLNTYSKNRHFLSINTKLLMKYSGRPLSRCAIVLPVSQVRTFVILLLQVIVNLYIYIYI